MAPGASRAPTPANRRVFLIVLGRGHLNVVSHALDAAVDFVHRRLLPQDVVAVMAWNRATPFTTDHACVSAMLDRFEETHDAIEQDLSDWFSGLRGAFASTDIPPAIQAHIDRIFAAPPGAGATFTVPPEASLDRKADRDAETLAALLATERIATSLNPAQQAALAGDAVRRAQLSGQGLSFDAFVA